MLKISNLELEQQLMRERWGQSKSPVKGLARTEYQLYLIGNKELEWYKIGISTCPESRLSDFSLPFTLELFAKTPLFADLRASQLVEGKIHSEYAEKRVQREWFHSIDVEEFSVKVKSLMEFMLSPEWRITEEGENLRFGSEGQQHTYKHITLKGRQLSV